MSLYTYIRLYSSSLDREMSEDPLGRFNLTFSIIWFLLFILTFFVSATSSGEITFSVFRVLSPFLARIVSLISNLPLLLRYLILIFIPIIMGFTKTGTEKIISQTKTTPHTTWTCLRYAKKYLNEEESSHLLKLIPLFFFRGMGQIFIWFIAKLFLVLSAFIRSYNEFQGIDINFSYEEIVGKSSDVSTTTDQISSILHAYNEEIQLSESAKLWRNGNGIGRKMLLLLIYLLSGDLGHIEGNNFSVVVRKYNVLIGGEKETVGRFYIESRKVLHFNLIMTKTKPAQEIEQNINSVFFALRSGQPVSDISFFVKNIIALSKEKDLVKNDLELLLSKLDSLYAQ